MNMNDVAAVVEAAVPIQLPPPDVVVMFGAGLLVLGIISAIIMVGKDVAKSRRDKLMILTDRNDRMHELLLEILTDGIEDAELKGRISRHEAVLLYLQLQQKLGLHDLIPKKHLQKMVKATLKADREKRKQARLEGNYVEHPLTQPVKKFRKA